jgi:hypothetical protein
LIESLTSNNNKLLDHIHTTEDKLTVTNTHVAYLSEEIVSLIVSMYELVADGAGLSGVDDGLFSWRAAGRDSAQFKTEVDDCKKIIKFLETDIGCKNDIINKLRQFFWLPSHVSFCLLNR